MNILHINARLEKGGAAAVARGIHAAAPSYGANSEFIYGYGPGVGDSPIESDVLGAKKIGNKLQVFSNYSTYKTIGADFFISSKGKYLLEEAIKKSDVVHLHAIHSYFLPFDYIADILDFYNKKIVWTMHDYWLLTGRCAFTESCVEWRSGCGKCPTKKNYPPVFLDFSGKNFKDKRNIFKKIERNTYLVAPSEFVANSFREAFPGLNVIVHHNWIDADVEKYINNPIRNKYSIENKKNYIIIAADLSDTTKINYNIVKKLLQSEELVIHTIGDKSPLSGSNVVNHGKLLDKEMFVDILKQMNGLIFTSKKDTFGLVMVEALACGVPVFAVDSEASREILGCVGMFPGLDDNNVIKSFDVFEKNKLANKLNYKEESIKIFSSNVGIDRYYKLYNAINI